MRIDHESDYADRRRKEYPSITDQIEALMKGGQDLTEMRNRVQGVRNKYPKKKRRSRD